MPASEASEARRDTVNTIEAGDWTYDPKPCLLAPSFGAVSIRIVGDVSCLEAICVFSEVRRGRRGGTGAGAAGGASEEKDDWDEFPVLMPPGPGFDADEDASSGIPSTLTGEASAC